MSTVLDESTNGTHDSVIIQSETEELSEILSYKSKRKSELILEAAIKLEDKYTDHSVIASKLKKEWSTLQISPKYIEDILPAQYKRQYTKPEPVTPGMAEAFFRELSSTLKTVAKNCDIYADRLTDDMLNQKAMDILMDIHDMHENATQAMADTIKQLEGIHQFKDLFGLLEIIKAEAEAITNMLSERQKFNAAWKLTLKMLLIYKSADNVAKMIDKSKKNGGKHISDLNKDPELHRLAQTIAKCPKCAWDWSIWMERAFAAQKKGLTKIPAI